MSRTQSITIAVVLAATTAILIYGSFGYARAGSQGETLIAPFAAAKTTALPADLAGFAAFRRY